MSDERLHGGDDQPEQQEPETTGSRVEMYRDEQKVVVTSAGAGAVFAVMGGNVIRYDNAGNRIPDEVSGVQHPAPGMATFGGEVTVEPAEPSDPSPTPEA